MASRRSLYVLVGVVLVLSALSIHSVPIRMAADCAHPESSGIARTSLGERAFGAPHRSARSHERTGAAEFLLERSINHYTGANDYIARRVDRWRGKITLNDRLNSLFMMAINSDDLRVRAAAIEVDIAARISKKARQPLTHWNRSPARAEQGPRANALWDLGLLGGREIEPERALRILLDSIHDTNVNIRYWAIEGLAYLGTDGTIEPLLGIFHDDPSPMIRERAALQPGTVGDAESRAALQCGAAADRFCR